jgi:hypothetical protein
MILENNAEFKNIIISAFRYAIGRHTYILDETLEFIEEHPKVIDERVKYVMLREIDSRLSEWDNCWEMDKERIIEFQKWLLELEVK